MTDRYLAGIGASLWLGSLLAVVCGLTFRAIPSVPAAWRYRIWFIVLFVCATIPLLGLLPSQPDVVVHRATVAVPATQPLPLAPASTPSTAFANAVAGELSDADPAPATAPFRVNLAVALLPLIFAVLVAGGLIGLVLLLGQLLRLYRLKREALPLADRMTVGPELPSAGSRRARLLVSDELTQPSACGYLRPAILLPASLLPHLDEDQLRHLLLHESAHLWRWDDWGLLLERVLLLLCWWHPASWWVRRQLDTTRELACDALVAERVDRRAYARTLVTLAELSLPADRILAPAALQGVLSRRIGVLMLRDPSASLPMRSISGALAIIGVSLGILVHPPAVRTLHVVSDTVDAVHAHQGFARGRAALHLDSVFRAFERDGFSGTVLVAQGDAVLLDKGYGLADRDAGTAMLRSTRFSAAGMTKMFTAAAILALESEGRLAVTDSLHRWFPDLPTAMGNVTLHQLLIHADGLTRLSAPVYRADADAFLQAVAAGPSIFVPGASYRYNDFGHSILGVIIERVTGQSYEDYIRNRFLAPAGMLHTSFEPDGDAFATEYSGPADDLEPIAPRGYLWGRRGSLGLVTTSDDLFRWSRALHDPRILPATAWQKMQLTYGRTDWDAAAGYGWDLMAPRRGKAIWRRVAGTPGMEGELLYDPATDWTAVILVNTRLGWRFKVWDVITEYTD